MGKVKAKIDHVGRFGEIVKGKEYDSEDDNIKRAIEESNIFGGKPKKKAPEDDGVKVKA